MAKPLSEMETLFKALADATRLRILGLLLTGEICVCHIHESLRITQPKASRHLAYLRKARPARNTSVICFEPINCLRSNKLGSRILTSSCQRE